MWCYSLLTNYTWMWKCTGKAKTLSESCPSPGGGGGAGGLPREAWQRFD